MMHSPIPDDFLLGTWEGVRRAHECSPEGRRERLAFIFADAAYAIGERFTEADVMAVLEALERESGLFLQLIPTEYMEWAAKRLQREIVGRCTDGAVLVDGLSHAWKACLDTWRGREREAKARWNADVYTWMLIYLRRLEMAGQPLPDEI